MKKGFVTLSSNAIKGVLMKFKGRDKHAIPWRLEKLIKHEESVNAKMKEFHSMTFHYRRPLELLHMYNEIFQKQFYSFVPRKNPAFVIDCGSNIGLSVLYFKKILPTCKVLAYEPDSDNYHFLLQNTKSNGLTDVEPLNMAVWNANGTVSFDNSGTESSRISSNNATIEVKSQRLKDVIEEHEHIDFLKLDIEGAEYEVIVDCSDVLHKVDHIFLEYHGIIEENYKLLELFEIITKNGFKFDIKSASDLIPKPFIQKKSGLNYDIQLNIFCFK